MRRYTCSSSLIYIIAILLLAGTRSLSPTAHAQSFKVIYSFTGGADGANPYSGVVFDAAGNLYGTTAGGGDRGCFNGTCGVAFELSPGPGGWSDATLHIFTGGSDGGNPADSLISDTAGNLYGTTLAGGVTCKQQDYGCGTAFELSPGGWTETMLYSFPGSVGYGPSVGLTSDKHGHLYSTLPTGQVYELIKGTSGWKEKTLYTFTFCGKDESGSETVAPLILDAAGNLYGTTSACGSFNGGTVFELLYGSWKEKTLYEFKCGSDSCNPFAGLVFDKAGSLYGTTRFGNGYGTVYKLTRSSRGQWKEAVLHRFKGGTDGREPFSTLVFDKAGNLYGTTFSGGGSGCGGSGCGTVFKLSYSSGGRWKERVLHRFTGASDGSNPYFVSLAIDAAGNLYGTADAGGNPGCFGNFGCGVVFEITP